MGNEGRETLKAPSSFPIPHFPFPVVPVACGILINARGEVLLAQRPDGKIAAGYWEFPGGKIEVGESPRVALARELEEELGVRITHAEPLLRFTHHYSNRSIALDCWRVRAWQGLPQGREGQALRWLPAAQLSLAEPLLPTVAPIARALQLPSIYRITPDGWSADAIAAAIARLPPQSWLRLRQPSWTAADYSAHAPLLIALAQAAGHRVIVDGSPERAKTLAADGWHARADQLAGLSARPELPFCFASCHNAAELAQAAALGFDAAVLGPVQPTRTHPDALPLGWQQFAQLAAQADLPVYAIGGVSSADLTQATAHGAIGVAGIRAFWPKAT